MADLPKGKYPTTRQQIPEALASWYQRGLAMGQRDSSPTSIGAWFNSPSFMLNNAQNGTLEDEYLRGMYESQRRGQAVPQTVYTLPEASAVRAEVPSARPLRQVPSKPAVAPKQPSNPYDSLGFGAAYRTAGKAGEAEFTWKGKRYKSSLGDKIAAEDAAFKEQLADEALSPDFADPTFQEEPIQQEEPSLANGANRFRDPGFSNSNFGSSGYRTRGISTGYGGAPDPLSAQYDISLLQRYRSAADANRRLQEQRRNELANQ